MSIPKFFKRKRDEQGSTLIELAIAIPIVLLIGGVIFSTLGQGILLQRQMELKAYSANVAQETLSKVKNSKTCAVIRNQVGDFTDSGGFNRADIIFVNKISGNTCKEGLNTFVVSVLNKDDGETIYEDSIDVYL